MKATLTAKELGLRRAVAPIDVAASVTSLRGMPGVYCHNLTSESLSLVLQKTFELGKTPGVEPALGFSTRGFDPRPDISEIFHNDSCAWLNAAENRGRKNVVAIPSESLFTTSEASKVPMSRLRTVGLQCTSKAEYSFNNFLHVSIAMKAVVRADSRASNTQVNTDSLVTGNEGNFRQANHDVEIEPSSAVDEVSRSRRTAHHILGIIGKVKQNLYSAMSGSQVHDTPLPIQGESVQIITRWAEHRLRALGSQPFLLSGDCRLHRFGSFLSGLDMQVRDEIRQSSLTVAVCQAMKRVGVAVVLFPSCTADNIERLGELLHCFMQSFSLFLRRLERYANRSIHTIIIPYIIRNLQIKYKEVRANSPAT